MSVSEADEDEPSEWRRWCEVHGEYVERCSGCGDDDQDRRQQSKQDGDE